MCMILYHGGGITAGAKGTWSCCPQNWFLQVQVIYVEEKMRANVSLSCVQRCMMVGVSQLRLEEHGHVVLNTDHQKYWTSTWRKRWGQGSSLCMILHHGGGITAMAKGTWSCCPQNWFLEVQVIYIEEKMGARLRPPWVQCSITVGV